MITDYNIENLQTLAPVLKATVQALSAGSLKIRGLKLMQATDQLTRGADLLSILIPNSGLDKCIPAYLIPAIKSYLQETQGRMPVSPLINLLPSAALLAHTSGWLQGLIQ
ncbi:MAG: hypothetical protein ACRESO_00275 [Gammaproteobacteria bacterium]